MCARNVLIALREECPSAHPLPILFLESEMVFEDVRKTQSERESARARWRERESWMQRFTRESGSMGFDIPAAYRRNLRQTQLSLLINVTWR